MKRTAFILAVACAFTFSSCGETKQIDTTHCKEHERNCPLSEDCPEHPECEAHERCPEGEDCKKHPSCVAYDQSKG